MADGVSSMVLKSTLKSTEQRQALDIDAIFAGMTELSPEPAAQYCPQSSSNRYCWPMPGNTAARCDMAPSWCPSNSNEAGVSAVVRDADSEGVETVSR